MTIWRKYYSISGLEVTESGGVRRYYKDDKSLTGKSPYPHPLKHKIDEDGNKYITTFDHGRLMVDKLVATCFWGKPRNGQEFIIHRDKNKEHCWKSNLMWATSYEYGEFYKDDPTVNTPDGYRLVTITERNNRIYVSNEGKVKIDGKEATIFTELYDSDVDYERATQPYVNIYRRSVYAKAENIEKFVAAA